MIAEDNGGADRGSDLVFLDRIARGEPWVGHRVGREHAFADHRGVEDGARDMDGLYFFGVLFFGIANDSGHHLVFVCCAGDHDDASLGLELGEDQIHHGFEEFSFVDDPCGDRGE